MFVGSLQTLNWFIILTEIYFTKNYMNRGAKFPMLARRIMNFLFWPLYFPHASLADDKDFSGINLFMMNHWQGKNREDRHVFISSKETLSVSFLRVLS